MIKSLVSKITPLLIVCVLLAMMVAPAFAQEAIILPDGSMPLDVVLESLIKLIYDATYLPFAAGMVLVATALTKRIGFLKRVSSSVLSLWWTVLLWAVWVIATEAGYGGQFESLITGLTTIGAALLGVTLTPMAAGQLYKSAKAQKVAIIGFSRKQTLSRIADDMYGNPDNPLTEGPFTEPVEEVVADG